MSRSISSGHVLPPNPTFIDFPLSDGDEGQWPTNTTRAVDNEGHVNYMRVVPIDESLCIKWRCEVGASLALQLKKPGVCVFFFAVSVINTSLRIQKLGLTMSCVAGPLVIRCLITIKGQQVHHDMMPI